MKLTYLLMRGAIMAIGNIKPEKSFHWLISGNFLIAVYSQTTSLGGLGD